MGGWCTEVVLEVPKTKEETNAATAGGLIACLACPNPSDIVSNDFHFTIK